MAKGPPIVTSKPPESVSGKAPTSDSRAGLPAASTPVQCPQGHTLDARRLRLAPLRALQPRCHAEGRRNGANSLRSILPPAAALLPLPTLKGGCRRPTPKTANQGALSALRADRRIGAQSYREREAERARDRAAEMPAARRRSQGRAERVEGKREPSSAGGALGAEGQELGIQTQLHVRPLSNEG
ncbi:unnamed protein product [Rangifer tarandus platyrhynchus]|uniref:Uncharacterized protein n=1 Tax=Rangifer tarandus platyrhynchus TaxID=3082113 RepID=A0AC59Z2F4_RANTA